MVEKIPLVKKNLLVSEKIMKKNRIQQRKEREKEQRRNEIIKAAEELFVTRGFEATTMEEIALEAALSKGALYYYFDSKDDLYLVIATKAIKKLNDLLERSILKSEPGIEKLLSLGSTVYTFSQNYPEYYKMSDEIRSNLSYLSIFKKEASREPLSHNEAKMKNEIDRYKQNILSTIEEAITNKSIKSDLPVLLIGSTLAVLTNGLISELNNQQNWIKNIGINPEEIITLVFKWIRKALEPKKENV